MLFGFYFTTPPPASTVWDMECLVWNDGTWSMEHGTWKAFLNSSSKLGHRYLNIYGNPQWVPLGSPNK